MRKSGLSDEQRVSELAACASEDDHHPGDGWTTPPSIATAAERLGWYRHANGADAPTGPARLVGWLAREVVAGDDCEPDDVDLTAEYEGQPDVEPDILCTASIDSDLLGPAVQINGCCDAPPMFTPDEAEALADELLLGANAARQAAKDGYSGPAVVVELTAGDEPEHGVEFDVEQAICTAPHDGDCQYGACDGGPMVCVMPFRRPAPVPMAWAPSTCDPVQPTDLAAQLPTFITCSVLGCGAATVIEAAPVVGWAQIDGQWWCLDHRSRREPTAENCRLLGAEHCEHDAMTAEETQVVFGKEGAR